MGEAVIQKGKQAGAQESQTGEKRTQEGVWTWAEQQKGLDYSWDLMVISVWTGLWP